MRLAWLVMLLIPLTHHVASTAVSDNAYCDSKRGIVETDCNSLGESSPLCIQGDKWLFESGCEPSRQQRRANLPSQRRTHTDDDFGLNPLSCQIQWSGNKTDDRGPCFGATWENFQYHLYNPLIVWFALVSLGYPFRLLFHYLVDPTSAENHKYPYKLMVYRIVGNKHQPPPTVVGFTLLTGIYLLQIAMSCFETLMASSQMYSQDSADDHHKFLVNTTVLFN